MRRIEMKFLIDAPLALQVQDWAREHLGVDENCNASTGDSYDIHTLYLDTPQQDILHRVGPLRATKVRMRRYGTEQTLWLETKRKKALVVKKSRTAVFESDWLSRRSTIATSPELKSIPWCADWFLDHVLRHALQPAIQMSYRRFARTSVHDGDALRLTIDSRLSSSPPVGWTVTQSPANRCGADAEAEILELKFHDQMPHLFKKLLRTFPLRLTGFSKYRTSMLEQHATRSDCVDASRCGETAFRGEDFSTHG